MPNNRTFCGRSNPRSEMVHAANTANGGRDSPRMCMGKEEECMIHIRGTAP